MSKIYKIKHLKLSKMFLGSVCIGIVPAAIQLFPLILTSIASGGGILGVILVSLSCLFMPIGAGIVGVVIGAAYNYLSPKIGQFEIELEEVEQVLHHDK